MQSDSAETASSWGFWNSDKIKGNGSSVKSKSALELISTNCTVKRHFRPDSRQPELNCLSTYLYVLPN